MEEFLLPALIVARASLKNLHPLPGALREEPELPDQWERSVGLEEFLEGQLIPIILWPQICNPHQKSLSVGSKLGKTDPKEV